MIRTLLQLQSVPFITFIILIPYHSTDKPSKILYTKKSTMVKKQILPAVLTLCFVKAIGNARVTHIFPFIASCMSHSNLACWNQLTSEDLLSIGVPPKDVPVYAGLAEALISIGDLVFMPLVSLGIDAALRLLTFLARHAC